MNAIVDSVCRNFKMGTCILRYEFEDIKDTEDAEDTVRVYFATFCTATGETEDSETKEKFQSVEGWAMHIRNKCEPQDTLPLNKRVHVNSKTIQEWEAGYSEDELKVMAFQT